MLVFLKIYNPYYLIKSYFDIKKLGVLQREYIKEVEWALGTAGGNCKLMHKKYEEISTKRLPGIRQLEKKINSVLGDL